MKILIAYSTKTGSTRNAAAMLADALRQKGADVDLQDLSAVTAPPKADAVIVGGSVRMNQWNKLSRRYAAANEQVLLQKPVAFFACRCGQDDTRALLAPQLGEALANAAVGIVSLGGEMDIQKQHGFDRMVVKLVSKNPDAGMKPAGILPDAVASLADTVWDAVNHA